MAIDTQPMNVYWSGKRTGLIRNYRIKNKDSVDTLDDLPNSDNTIGDMYTVTETGKNYVWNGLTWDEVNFDIYDYNNIINMPDFALDADVVHNTGDESVSGVKYFADTIRGSTIVATAFASSKDVTLTGAVTGTASSTGGWSVSTVWRSCIVGRNDSGTSNPWYKVASRKLTGGSSAYNITFYVENANSANKSFGILRVSVNTNSDKTINASVTKFAWLANDGFAEEDFVLVCPATAEPTVELWTKVAAGYLRRRFVVISEGGNTSTGILWTLFDAVSAGQEASIPTEGTQVTSDYAIKTELSAKADDSAVVHNTGDEGIYGIKYFANTVRASTIVALAADTSMVLRSATSSGDGAALTLYSKDDSSKPGCFRAVPRTPNGYKVLEAYPDGTFTWGGQAIQTASDERMKTPLSSVPDAVLDAWEDVQWGQFKYLDAVEQKGESARYHLGVIAQRIKNVFEEHELDACDYGILCYDKEEDMWTVRYAEALAMEAACQRKRADRLEARIVAIEEMLK